jgi:hypothetical protein
MGAPARTLIPPEQFGDFYAQSGLFADFSDDGFFRGFAGYHAATRKLPEAGIVAFDQQYPLLL